MIDMRLGGVPRGLARPARRIDALRDLPTPDAIDVHVGSRLRARRTELGLSQGALGRHLGLTFSQVQKYEKGTNRIGAGRLYHLAALLGVPVQHFFDGLDEPAPSRADAASAAEAGRFHEVFARISDPNARQALLSLASSMVKDG